MERLGINKKGVSIKGASSSIRDHIKAKNNFDLLIHESLPILRNHPTLKGSISSSIPCTCRYLTGLCLSPFSWPMKMATTKEKQETIRARHAG